MCTRTCFFRVSYEGSVASAAGVIVFVRFLYLCSVLLHLCVCLYACLIDLVFACSVYLHDEYLVCVYKRSVTSAVRRFLFDCFFCSVLLWMCLCVCFFFLLDWLSVECSLLVLLVYVLVRLDFCYLLFCQYLLFLRVFSSPHTRPHFFS